MGIVRAEITLKNVNDILRAKDGHIKKKNIRTITVSALVDSGAWTMVINDATREKLGLEIGRTAPGTLADGTKNRYKLTSPLEITWKDRSVICEALVVPTAKENLLGAIPMEAMDVMINPRGEELVGVHGDEILHYV